MNPFVHMEPLTIAAAVVAVAILGLSKGGFAGVGMISTPLLSLTIPPATAAAILMPILIFQDAISVWGYRAQYDRRNLVILLPSALCGVVLGTVLIRVVDERVVLAALGALSIVFGVERIYRSLRRPTHARAPNVGVGLICGCASGFTSMLSHAGVPPFQFFVVPQNLEKDTYIGTSVIFFAVVNWIKFPFFLSLGQITVPTLSFSLVLAPIALASVLLGMKIARRVSVATFQGVINGLLIAVGVVLIVQAVS